MNLKPSDRCIIIRSHCGDEGAIVVIDRYFNAAKELFDKTIWDLWCDVIVTSLGSPLHSTSANQLHPSFHQTRPYRSDWLRKLPEVTEDKEVRQVELVGAGTDEPCDGGCNKCS